MEKEAPDKFMGMDGHFSDFTVSFPISVCKGDFAVINGEDPVV